MILRGERVREAGPDRRRQIGVEAGQDHGALRQARDRLHEELRGTARAGGACDEHGVGRRRFGPSGGERFDHHALAGLGVGGVAAGFEIGLHQAQKGERPLPVAGEVADVEAGERVGADAFAVHFVHQPGEAIGEVEECGARGEVRLGVQQGGDNLGEFEAAAQRGDRWRQVETGAAGDVRDEAEARQKARGARVEDLAQTAAGAGGVDVDRGARQVGAARVEAGDQLGGEIDAGRQGEDARTG